MTTAPPEDQRRLLEVQALDIRLQQLAHRRASLPAIARIAELDQQIADLNTSLVQSRTSASDLRRELKKAEGDVEQVRTRAARDQSRLDSGNVGAKDAQALVTELEALGRRQGVLEEVELDVMERLEAHEVALGQLESANSELEESRADAERELDAEAAVIDAEIATTAAEREASTAGIDKALLALYDKVRAQNGGRGVVGLKGTYAEGLNVNLSPVEVRDIVAAAPEQVVRLEEYGHIVVRLAAGA